MYLRDVVMEKTVEYFRSEHWLNLQSVLARGRCIRHAHAYVDTILHPDTLQKLVEQFYLKTGHPLKRKIRLQPQARGVVNIYNVLPEVDWAHFELFAKYNNEVVIVPSTSGTRGGKNFEYWDDDFMNAFHKKFNFRTDPEALNEAKKYFYSSEWKLGYYYMAQGESVHSHCTVETSVHPEKLLELGCAAIREKGWDISKAVAVVFGVRGFDVGKVTFLLKKPEIVLELEWEYNADTVIQPGAEPIYRLRSEKELPAIMRECEYITFNNDEINKIICESTR